MIRAIPLNRYAGNSFLKLRQARWYAQSPLVGKGSQQPKVHQKGETPVEQALREAKELAVLEHLRYKEPVAAVKRPLWSRVKEEALHYWQGTKLLGAEIKVSSRLLVKLLKGPKLSRRELRQLRRTTGDLMRLVPFVIIVIIPFLEFALPILLRFFPNLLPSTFESKFQEEEKRRKLLKLRVEMARFLQDTVGEVSLSGTSKSADAKEFTEFFHKCRTSGEPAPTDDIIRVARKFQDELTLSNLSRPQLVSMAKVNY